jgi:steroid delta-isomerase-like uncharacterized protein
MTREDLERIDRQGMAAWDGHDVDGFVGLLADGFVWTDVTLPEPMRTTEQARQYMQGWFTAFPDMRVTQTYQVVGEDAVAAEVAFTGTNTGPMRMGDAEVPPTGRSVVGRGAYFAQVDQAGQIVRFSSHPDVAGLMMQLGINP